MGKYTFLIIHCTDTPKDRKVTRADLEQWHLKGRGWDRLGYSDMIHLDGTIENLVPYNDNDIIENDEMTWGCAGKNSVSRHVVIVGGKGGDHRTAAQNRALENYIKKTIRKHPYIKVAGHYQFSNKVCPNFNVTEFCEEIGLKKYNIYYT